MGIVFSIFLILSTLGQELCLEGRDNCMLDRSSAKRKSKLKINVFGDKLETCSLDPLTGFFRDGTCHSDDSDRGNHSVCAILTREFLEYTKAQGNDLSTPNPRYRFPGLRPGNKWCLCASRWKQAKLAGYGTMINLKAISIRSLEVLEDLDLTWRHRVVRCSRDLYKRQFEILGSNLSLNYELKLIALPTSKLTKKCQLVGLDGGVKLENSTVFTMKKLEQVINSMPMRQNELNQKGKLSK